MQLSAHNQLLGLNYTDIIAKALLSGQAMSHHQLLELARMQQQAASEGHRAGMAERQGQLNMMAALFGQLNQNLNTTVGSLSIHGQTLADLGSAMHDVQMAQISAADAQRDLAQLVNANSSRPPPPPPGAARRARSLSNEVEVTEIPHTDPEADAAMDRAVVVAPTRPVRRSFL